MIHAEVRHRGRRHPHGGVERAPRAHPPHPERQERPGQEVAGPGRLDGPRGRGRRADRADRGGGRGAPVVVRCPAAPRLRTTSPGGQGCSVARSSTASSSFMNTTSATRTTRVASGNWRTKGSKTSAESVGRLGHSPMCSSQTSCCLAGPWPGGRDAPAGTPPGRPRRRPTPRRPRTPRTCASRPPLGDDEPGGGAARDAREAGGIDAQALDRSDVEVVADGGHHAGRRGDAGGRADGAVVGLPPRDVRVPDGVRSSFHARWPTSTRSTARRSAPAAVPSSAPLSMPIASALTRRRWRRPASPAGPRGSRLGRPRSP